MLNSKIKVLIINENSMNSNDIVKGLAEGGLATEAVTSPQRTQMAMDTSRPDVLVVDGPTPLEVVRWVRARNVYDRVSVVVVGALDSESKVLEAFDLGADDYLPRPLSQAMFNARLKSLTKRRNQLWQPEPELIELGPLKINISAHQAVLSEKVLPLTLTEFRLLKELVTHVNTVRSRENMRNHALNNLSVNDRTIDVHIASLRRKLGEFGKNIRTVRSLGYRLAVPQSTSL